MLTWTSVKFPGEKSKGTKARVRTMSSPQVPIGSLQWGYGKIGERKRPPGSSPTASCTPPGRSPPSHASGFAHGAHNGQSTSPSGTRRSGQARPESNAPVIAVKGFNARGSGGEAELSEAAVAGEQPSSPVGLLSKKLSCDNGESTAGTVPTKDGSDAVFNDALDRYDVFKEAVVRKAYGMVKRADIPHDRLMHNVAVGKEVAGMGLGPEAVASAILHDALAKEVEWAPREAVAEACGEEIATLVEGIARMHRVSYMLAAEDHVGSLPSDEVEGLRKMLLSMTDARVVLVKLAAVAQDLRGDFVFRDDMSNVQAKALQALEVFAPLANRLGVTPMKSALEDLAFRVLWPHEHDHLAQEAAEKADWTPVQSAMGFLTSRLPQAGVRVISATGRRKGLLSAWRKMEKKDLRLEQVHDLRAVRLIVDSVENCYLALSFLHCEYRTVRTKDYLRAPKGNGYKSIHTVLLDAHGDPFEVQIRTPEMHIAAELGACAHWRYKEELDSESLFLEQQVAWARYLLSWRITSPDQAGPKPLGNLVVSHSAQCDFNGAQFDDKDGCTCAPLAAPGCGEVSPKYAIIVVGGRVRVVRLEQQDTLLTIVRSAARDFGMMAWGSVVLDSQPVFDPLDSVFVPTAACIEVFPEAA